MKQQNMVLNQDTTKRHAKRLFKVLKDEYFKALPPNFNLSQSQEIMAKSLGFNNWHELSEVFKTPLAVSNTSSDKTVQVSQNSDNNLYKIQSILVSRLNLSTEDMFIIKNEKEDKIFEFKTLFNQYGILPYLLSVICYHNEKIRHYFHENCYLQSVSEDLYNIKFKNSNPIIESEIIEDIVELFLLSDTKSTPRVFNFALIHAYFWPNSEHKNLTQAYEDNQIRPPYLSYEAHDLWRFNLQRSFVDELDAYELSTIIVKLSGENTRLLIEPVIEALSYMRAKKEIVLDMSAITEFLVLDNIIKLFKGRRDFPNNIRQGLSTYLRSLSDFEESALKQNATVIEQHGSMQLKVVAALNALRKIEQEDVLIFDTNWWRFLYYNISYPSYIVDSIDFRPATENHFKKSKYENELWFDRVALNDKNLKGERRLNFLFKENKNVYLSDVVKSLYNISLMDHELELARMFIFSYPRIKKISEDLQDIYEKNKDD